MSSKKSMHKVVRVPFQMVRYYTGSSSTFNLARLQLRPDQMGARLAAIKDQYSLYRFVQVRVRSMAPYAGTFVTSTDPRTVTHAVAYSQEYMANVPTAFDTMSQLSSFDVSDGFHYATITLNRALLVGQEPLKWFRTDQDEPSGTAPSDFTDQGWVYWAMYNDYGFGGLRHYAHISGVVEFCVAKDPSLDYAPTAAVKVFHGADVAIDGDEKEPPEQGDRSAFQLAEYVSVEQDDDVRPSTTTTPVAGAAAPRKTGGQPSARVPNPKPRVA